MLINKQFLLSTRNGRKVTEIRESFRASGIEILTLETEKISGKANEPHNTLFDNAFEKASFAHERRPNLVAMADDTGLFIDALGGKPGVHAATWAGKDATTDEITDHTLERMRGIVKRRGVFRTVALIMMPDEGVYHREGEIGGWIHEERQCVAIPGMPYSPLFQPDGSKKVWGQMTVAEEEAISHRGIAFRKLLTEVIEPLLRGVH